MRSKIGRNKDKCKAYKERGVKEKNKERKLNKLFSNIIRKNKDKVYERVGNNLLKKEEV